MPTYTVDWDTTTLAGQSMRIAADSPADAIRKVRGIVEGMGQVLVRNAPLALPIVEGAGPEDPDLPDYDAWLTDAWFVLQNHRPTDDELAITAS